MGLLAGTPKCVFSMLLGFLTTWWLDSKGKCLQRERESQVEAEAILEPSSGSPTVSLLLHFIC